MPISKKDKCKLLNKIAIVLFVFVMGCQECIELENVSHKRRYREDIGRSYVLLQDCCLISYLDDPDWAFIWICGSGGEGVECYESSVREAFGDAEIISFLPKGTIFSIRDVAWLNKRGRGVDTRDISIYVELTGYEGVAIEIMYFNELRYGKFEIDPAFAIETTGDRIRSQQSTLTTNPPPRGAAGSGGSEESNP